MTKTSRTYTLRTKPFTLLVCVVSTLAMTSARSLPSGDEPSGSGTTDVQELQQQWTDAVEALKSYSAVQRDKAVASAAQALRGLDQRFDRLEVQAQRQWSRLSEGARQQRNAALRKLRRQRNELAEWYGGMKHSSADAWDDVKQGFVDAYANLSSSLNRAQAEFEDNASTRQSPPTSQ